MIDAYMWGTINRMSPEAPVPVVDIEKYEIRLGGAVKPVLFKYQRIRRLNLFYVVF